MSATSSKKSCRFDRVLLIDDDPIDNIINERIISSSYFASNIKACSSADQGLQYLKHEMEVDRVPDLIFLDLKMPVKDGFAFLEEYTQLMEQHADKLSKCKIIVLSGSLQPDDINRASIHPQVIKYLNKPLNPRYLEAIPLI